jgi:hypothetical protein
MFLQKVHVERFSQKNRQNFRCQFFRDFFLIAFSGLSPRWEFKNTQKEFLQKNRPKIQNRFFLDFFYHVFGRFSVRGVQKHDKTNIGKINLTPSLFRTLTHPRRGSPTFFWPAPWNQPFGTCCLGNNVLSHCNATALSCVVKNCGAECFACKGKSADLAAVECAAWQDLYDATNGPKWSHCSDARSDPCSCSYTPPGDGNCGVDCTGGHITSMAFFTNNLNGTIPSSLAKLPKMTTLALNWNRLTGLVPSLPFEEGRGRILYYPVNLKSVTVNPPKFI